jgi:hypothetical protein
MLYIIAAEKGGAQTEKQKGNNEGERAASAKAQALAQADQGLH